MNGTTIQFRTRFTASIWVKGARLQLPLCGMKLRNRFKFGSDDNNCPSKDDVTFLGSQCWNLMSECYSLAEWMDDTTFPSHYIFFWTTFRQWLGVYLTSHRRLKSVQSELELLSIDFEIRISHPHSRPHVSRPGPVMVSSCLHWMENFSHRYWGK